MNEKEYFEKRLDDQIDWYSTKSSGNKKKFQRGQVSLILMAALVTLSGLFAPADFPWITYAVPLLGALIAIVSGLLGLYKFQENHLHYRTTAEALKHEKFLYLTKCEPYHDDKALQLFVRRVETFLAQENMQWAQFMQKNGKENAAKAT